MPEPQSQVPHNEGGGNESCIKAPETHPMFEAIKSYREAMRPPKQDLNIEFFIKTLRVMNDSSALKVARNPVDANGRWRRETVLRNVRSIELDDKGRLSLQLRGDNTEYPVEKAIDEIIKYRKRLGNDDPIMLTFSEEKQVRITDAYSHAFARDFFAGLPFDLVLAYFDEETDAPQKDAEDSQE